MLKKIKNVLIVLAMFILVFCGYVMIVNRNATNMTGRQKILKAIYPVTMWMSKISDKNREALSHEKMAPPVSFYSLKVVLNNGELLDMASLKGKKIILVNTASACGYTAQYDQLQKLYKQLNEKLVVVGFPANDFKEQEQGTDKEIASFCKKNFGVDFPLVQKSVVIKQPDQNSVFKWLTTPAQNGWNSQAPTWNFCKYVINEEGMLTNYFGPGIEPAGEEIMKVL